MSNIGAEGPLPAATNYGAGLQEASTGGIRLGRFASVAASSDASLSLRVFGPR
jgi:hypothetical protein